MLPVWTLVSFLILKVIYIRHFVILFYYRCLVFINIMTFSTYEHKRHCIEYYCCNAAVLRCEDKTNSSSSPPLPVNTLLQKNQSATCTSTSCYETLRPRGTLNMREQAETTRQQAETMRQQAETTSRNNTTGRNNKTGKGNEQKQQELFVHLIFNSDDVQDENVINF